MKKLLCIIVPVLLCFLIGYVSQLFQSDSIEQWYPFLNKAPLTPPNSVFPIAWSILYVLMGISIGLIIMADDEDEFHYISLFVLQLLLNFIWSIVFFYLQSPLLGIIDIVLLDIVLCIYIIRTHKRFRVSSLLFIPCLLWVLFATYLNGYILFNN